MIVQMSGWATVPSNHRLRGHFDLEHQGEDGDILSMCRAQHEVDVYKSEPV